MVFTNPDRVIEEKTLSTGFWLRLSRYYETAGKREPSNKLESGDTK